MTKNQLLAGLAGVVLGLCSIGANAAKGLTYTYGEVGYSNLDSDDIDANGATALISYGATDYVHVKLEYTRFNADREQKTFFTKKTDSFDIDRFIFGIGGNYRVFDKGSFVNMIDVLGTVSYYDAENSGNKNSGSINDSDRGVQYEAGVRALIKKKLELNATVTYLDIDSFDGETGFGGGAVYKFYKKYSASGTIRHFSQDDTTEFFVGLRLDF